MNIKKSMNLNNIKKMVVQSTLSGFILLGALILVLFPEDAIETIAGVMSIIMFVIGLMYMYYYVSLGRFMVGGRMIFYIGLILLDFAIMSGTLIYKSDRYLLLYLIVMNAFYGVIQILHARQGKKYGSKGWRFKLFNGIVNLLISLCCIIFITSGNNVVYIFAAGLVHTALVNFVSGVQKEEPAVIQ